MTGVVEPRADLRALTGIRGIAAWLVVLYHIRMSAAGELPPEVIRFLGKGYLAVDLFFILSGFVLWLNYSARLQSEGMRAVPLFLARRIARIWPLHAFILGCAALFALLLAATGRANPAQYPWAEFPLHLMLVQNWGLTGALSWNDPAWSISCESGAYLLFPLIVLAGDRSRLSSAPILLLILLLAGILHAAMTWGGAANLGDDIPRFGLLRATMEFTIGTLLCSLWMRWRLAPRLPLLACAALGAAGAIAYAAGAAPETLVIPLILASLIMAVALTAERPGNPLGWRPLHYLGEISYSTYLAHFLLFVLFKLLFVDDAANVPLPHLGMFLLATLAVSALLFHLVERPAQRGLNRAFDGMRKRAGRLRYAG
jgi:peptidoglycan/LPS O-acetylase OafA/YrhL